MTTTQPVKRDEPKVRPMGRYVLMRAAKPADMTPSGLLHLPPPPGRIKHAHIVRVGHRVPPTVADALMLSPIGAQFVFDPYKIYAVHSHDGWRSESCCAALAGDIFLIDWSHVSAEIVT